MDNVISSYSAKQAEEDGFLVPLIANRWAEISGGSPIYATRQVFLDISLSGLREIWNDYVAQARTRVKMELFETKMNGSRIWVMYDGSVFTLLYPEEY